jgi:GDP-4-dehydro-6-deoxy-D-mannose reductase
MRALVTGAAGFVGGYLAAALAGEGAEAAGLDAAPAGDHPVRPSGFAIERCDLLDQGAVEAALARHRPETIFHLAAQSSAARSFEDPRGTIEANVTAAVVLLESIRRIVPRARVVLAGSCEEYGRRTPGEMPLGEESPIEPVSPYAASKAAQNLLAMQYHRAFGLDVVLTRSFSHTGPGQTDVFALPSFARQCAAIAAGAGERVLRTGNLDVTRDFLDVRYVARAYIAIARQGRSGTVYNVCSGHGLLLADALRALIELAGGAISVRSDSALERPSDVPILVGDNARLRRDCRWEPKIGRRRMLADLYAWWSGRGSKNAD